VQRCRRERGDGLARARCHAAIELVTPFAKKDRARQRNVHEVEAVVPDGLAANTPRLGHATCESAIPRSALRQRGHTREAGGIASDTALPIRSIGSDSGQ